MAILWVGDQRLPGRRARRRGSGTSSSSSTASWSRSDPDVLTTLGEKKELNDEHRRRRCKDATEFKETFADRPRPPPATGGSDPLVPSQREIRRRIGSVRNIKQITRAMQFVAASKLRRVQDAALQARPVQREAGRGAGRRRGACSAARIIRCWPQREGGTRLIVLFTTDRGLAGSLNTNTIRFALARTSLDHERATSKVVTVGRKGQAACAARGRRSRPASRASATGRPSRRPAAGAAGDRRLPGRHVLDGRPRLPGVRLHAHPAPGRERLLPIEPSEDTEGIPGRQFIFEPNADAVLRPAAAALRGDAHLPGGAGAHRQRAVGARWSPCATPPRTPRSSSRT